MWLCIDCMYSFHRLCCVSCARITLLSEGLWSIDSRHTPTATSELQRGGYKQQQVSVWADRTSQTAGQSIEKLRLGIFCIAGHLVSLQDGILKAVSQQTGLVL
ncbi:hypothetical protein FQA47_013973 [Oryzias melastigma]|uniref:Uncharacterized protein n=1 Tax=Oryzias melastigma TaxID=30732 RepID=A0A834FAQ4_ORYME|nr:hypothetical protein FQA47_013973 [Oryzias melastigma]